MKIIKEFPVIKTGDILTVTDCQDETITGKVIGVWYPREGDTWSETEECRHLGYGGSKSNEAFPQLLLDTHKGILCMYGTDAKDILKIASPEIKSVVKAAGTFKNKQLYAYSDEYGHTVRQIWE